MSKSQFKNNVDVELRKINDAIDKKILLGMPYRYESRRHKALLSQSRRLKKGEWFNRFSFLGLF